VLYRRAVVARLGYCAKDRRRVPLRGDEIMACWERPDTEPVVLFAVG